MIHNYFFRNVKLEKTQSINCRYCNDNATMSSYSNPLYTMFFHCKTCNITYEVFNASKDVAVISMYCNINNQKFALRQYLLQNRSRIEIIPSNDEDTLQTVIDFDFLMPHVNPSNLIFKIKTYIVFS